MSLLATKDIKSILAEHSDDENSFELSPKSLLSAKSCTLLISKFSKLKSLTLRDCNLNGVSVEILVQGLEKQRMIQHLFLGLNKELGAEGAISVARLLLLQPSTIETIDLSDTCCHDEGCEALAVALKQNTTLTKLDLGGQYPANHLTKRGMKALGDAFLSGIPLKDLSVFGNKIGDDGCVSLVEKLAVQPNHSLTSLNLCWNNLGVGAGNAIGIMLSTTNATLRTLNLETNPMHDAACKSMGLLMSMRSSPLVLETFMLTWAEITEDGATGLEQVFSKCGGLRYIDLSYNNIGNSGMASIVCGISTHSINTIQHLNFNSLQLTPGGISAVAELARKSSSLKYLNLSNNAIGDVGCCELVEALLTNKHLVLENLRFYGCKITEKGAISLGKLLSSKDSIKTLLLSKNSIKDEGALALFTALFQRWQKIGTTDNTSSPTIMKELPLIDSEVSAHATDLVQSAHNFKDLKIILHHAAQLGQLNLCKNVIKFIEPKAEAIKICQASTNTFVKKWAQSIGAFLARYVVEPGPAVHKSATCMVRFATDLECNGCRVAIKQMSERDQFEREIQARENDFNTTESVISIRGWHLPSNDNIITKKGRTKEREATNASNKYPYVLVMDRGGRSLFASISSERFAGFEVDFVSKLFRSAVEAVMSLHSSGICHGDIKPRNFLRTEISSVIQLCDLDVALPIGENRPPEVFKISTAYASPELMASSFFGKKLNASVAMDVWSLGVCLFELCAGRQLFVQDLSDDNLTRQSERNRLLMWVGISDAELGEVFKGVKDESFCHKIEAAKDLIRRLLVGNPFERLNMKQIKEHPFISGEKITQTTTPRYHMFISHAQSEAAGSVGTLHHHFASQMNFSVWRDVEQLNLTEEGMKNGVRDSDIFVLFLTSSTLTRAYCIKEITWAMEMKKFIVIVVERDSRFAPFDLNRWQRSLLTQDPATWKWVESTDLQVKYDDCPAAVCELVETAIEKNRFVTYRRRWFEVTPMVYAIVGEAARQGCQWAVNAPKDPSDLMGSLDPLSPDEPKMIIRVISLDHAFVRQLINSLETNPPGAIQCQWNTTKIQSDNKSNCNLVVLSKGLIKKGSTTLVELVKCLSAGEGVVFVYLGADDVGTDIGWQFYSKEHLNAPDIVRQALSDHEGITFRIGTLETSHEHRAMINEILRRFQRNDKTIKKESDQEEGKKVVPVEFSKKREDESKNVFSVVASKEIDAAVGTRSNNAITILCVASIAGVCGFLLGKSWK